MALGDIGAVIRTFEFDTDGASYPHIIHIRGDIYAIAYMDAGSQCRLKTFNITTAGIITEPSNNDLVVDSNYGRLPFIQHVRGNFYLIAYAGVSFEAYLKTVEISHAGAITDPPLDYYSYDTISETVNVAGTPFIDIAVVGFQGPDHDGWIKTFEIDIDGKITDPFKASWEFDETGAEPGWIVPVNSNVFALAYQGPTYNGLVKTFAVTLTGLLGTPPIGTLEFATPTGIQPFICHVTGNIYAIAYQGPGYDGWICSVSITSGGVVTATGHPAVEFDDDNCFQPSMVYIGANIVAIAYRGPYEDGWVKTVEISDAGVITDPPLKSFEFDDAECDWPSIIRISGNVYAVAYKGPGDDGFLKTFTIESPPEAGSDHSMMMGIGP